MKLLLLAITILLTFGQPQVPKSDSITSRKETLTKFMCSATRKDI